MALEAVQRYIIGVLNIPGAAALSACLLVSVHFFLEPHEL